MLLLQSPSYPLHQPMLPPVRVPLTMVMFATLPRCFRLSPCGSTCQSSRTSLSPASTPSRAVSTMHGPQFLPTPGEALHNFFPRYDHEKHHTVHCTSHMVSSQSSRVMSFGLFSFQWHHWLHGVLHAGRDGELQDASPPAGPARGEAREPAQAAASQVLQPPDSLCRLHAASVCERCARPPAHCLVLRFTGMEDCCVVCNSEGLE